MTVAPEALWRIARAHAEGATRAAAVVPTGADSPRAAVERRGRRGVNRHKRWEVTPLLFGTWRLVHTDGHGIFDAY